MTAASPPPAGPAVDSLSPAPPPPRQNVPEVKRAKTLVSIVSGIVYVSYCLWLLMLLLILPSPTGELRQLVLIGILSSFAGAVGFLAAAAFALKRISKADVSVAVRRRSMMKLIALLVPVMGLSIATPLLIRREPPLRIEITYPARAEDFVAPVSVTLSVEGAVEVLRKRNLRPVKYQWDFEGDGKLNEETILPVATTFFERQGSYAAVVRVMLEDGSFRRLARRIVIPRAVFSVSPPRPIVEKPVRLSVSHLLADPKVLKEVHWDLDGDGSIDEITKNLDIVHTFYVVGRTEVAATIFLQNQSQATYVRTLEVEEPAALPFPVTLSSDPRNLLGPVPFGAIFRIDTEEDIREVSWSFGDDREERGADLRRVGHKFSLPGIYPVTVKVRSASGVLAELTTLVRVTEVLQLPDLTFEGTPDVRGDTITEEVPVFINLTAQTSVPLVDFFWEAPRAVNVNATGATLQAVYRQEGTYTLTLVAQDAEGKAMRKQFTVQALPPSPAPDFQMKPSVGTAPLTVRFDASATFIPPGQEIAGYQWSFGDELSDETEVFDDTKAEHTYLEPDEYTVRLTVLMEDGKEFSTEKTLVVRKPELKAFISASRTTGVHAGDSVTFDGEQTKGSPPFTFEWDVRRDSEPTLILGQSADPSYAHVFEKAGKHTIRLTVRDEFSNKHTASFSLTVAP
ncbi:PKD domain-containing protein [Candidatus Peregrinibacteria bacterium]|nr:PKD domain-containing protein [Candidatus Peregrinibacteria bacterium]